MKAFAQWHVRGLSVTLSASLEPQPKRTSGLRSRSNVTNPSRHILSDVKGPQLLLGTHWSFHLCTDTLIGKMSHPDFPPSLSINNSLENHWLYTPGRTTQLIKNIIPKKNHDGQNVKIQAFTHFGQWGKDTVKNQFTPSLSNKEVYLCAVHILKTCSHKGEQEFPFNRKCYLKRTLRESSNQ